MRFQVLLISGCAVVVFLCLNAYVWQHIAAIFLPGRLPVPVLWTLTALLTVYELFGMLGGQLLAHHPVLRKANSIVCAMVLGLMLSSLLLFALTDGLRLLSRTGWLPDGLHTMLAGWYHRGLPVFAAACLLTLYAMGNAAALRTTSYAVAVDKPMRTPLKIGMLSDAHVGTALRDDQLARAVTRVMAEQPSLIVIGGDLFDDNTPPDLQAATYPILAQLTAPLGVYFVFGNHETYLESHDTIREKLHACGITVLQDEQVTIPNTLTIVGRSDDLANRLPLDRLLATVDHTLPLLLLDHQPKDLEAAAALGVDLQLSGHTHAGQLAPGGLLSRLVNEATYGMTITGTATHTIVSSGCSVWGAAIRTAKHCEVLSITLATATATQKTALPIRAELSPCYTTGCTDGSVDASAVGSASASAASDSLPPNDAVKNASATSSMSLM